MIQRATAPPGRSGGAAATDDLAGSNSPQIGQTKPSHKTVLRAFDHARRLALLKRKELARLIDDRLSRGWDVDGDPQGLALIVADLAFFLCPRTEFDVPSFDRIADRIGVEIPGDIASSAIRRVEAIADKKRGAYGAMTGQQVGNILGLTAQERQSLGLRILLPCDETREERQARLTAARRHRDRERARRKRAGLAVPRYQWEANSYAQRRPWDALGMSQRTWYRKGKPDASVTPVPTGKGPSPHDSSCGGGATDLCQKSKNTKPQEAPKRTGGSGAGGEHREPSPKARPKGVRRVQHLWVVK